MSKANKIPAEGDIILLDFNPQSGHEQAGKRPALVISKQKFNAKTGFALVCPITNTARGWPFEVPVLGSAKTTGVVLADQLKSLDYKSRNGQVIDSVDATTLNTVKSYVAAIIGL